MVHPIITVATLKGGSGKSTVAACLAVHWRLRGVATTLIDADPQRSVARIAARGRQLGGLPVVEDPTPDLWKTAERLSAEGRVVIDTPGFQSEIAVAALGAADFVLVPVRASPLDVDRMIDTLQLLVGGIAGWTPVFRCLLTQTTQGTVIARHIRAEIERAGFPLIEREMQSRIAYPEAALYGATPTLSEPVGAAAREIAVIAAEIDAILSVRRAALRA